MIESSGNDAKAEDGERRRLTRNLKQLRQEEDEEDEARALLENMQQNVDEAHAKASETKRRFYREIEEDLYSLDQEFGRPQ